MYVYMCMCICVCMRDWKLCVCEYLCMHLCMHKYSVCICAFKLRFLQENVFLRAHVHAQKF